MMNFIKHAVQQPFVSATAAAALVHSTWAIGTLFSGVQPAAEWGSIHFWGWLIPALLVAFAMDIGQVATSSDIRERGLTWQRGLTFFVFSAATYYLQWTYVVHHAPALELAPGVVLGRDFALMMRDAYIWIMPALLPLATMLYTVSGDRHVPISAPNSVPISAPNSVPISAPNSVPISAPNSVPISAPVAHLAPANEPLIIEDDTRPMLPAQSDAGDQDGTKQNKPVKGRGGRRKAAQADDQHAQVLDEIQA